MNLGLEQQRDDVIINFPLGANLVNFCREALWICFQYHIIAKYELDLLVEGTAQIANAFIYEVCLDLV